MSLQAATPTTETRLSSPADLVGGSGESAFAWDRLVGEALNPTPVARSYSCSDGHLLAEPDVLAEEAGSSASDRQQQERQQQLAQLSEEQQREGASDAAAGGPQARQHGEAVSSCETARDGGAALSGGDAGDAAAAAAEPTTPTRTAASLEAFVQVPGSMGFGCMLCFRVSAAACTSRGGPRCWNFVCRPCCTVHRP